MTWECRGLDQRQGLNQHRLDLGARGRGQSRGTEKWEWLLLGEGPME